MASEIQNVAEIVLAGPTLGLQVPTGMSTQSGVCNISAITSQPIQVFSLSGHIIAEDIDLELWRGPLRRLGIEFRRR